MTDTPEDESERIRKWREERAAVAETQKQERLKKAEADRQQRLKQAEKDKQERVRQAQLARETALKEEAAQKREEAKARLPSPQALEAARDRVLQRARRARRILFIQLLIFVILPTALVTGYTARWATPLYETQSVLVVSKADQENDTGLTGLLSGGAGGSTNLHETFMAHEYIQSQELLNQLEQGLGTVSLLSSDALDPVTRLRDMPFFKISKRDNFSRFVESSINVQTGLMTLYVRMPDPDLSLKTSNEVIRKTASQISALSEALYQERVLKAEEAVIAAQASLVEHQRGLTELQIESGEANPQARIEGVYSIIGQLELEREAIRTELDRALASDNTAGFTLKRLRDIEKALAGRIEMQRDQLLEVGDDQARPLNTLLVEYEIALLRVRIAEEILTTAITSLTEARKKAALGRSQFQIVAPPSPPELPTSPNVLLTGLVTLLTWIGIFACIKILTPARLR